MAMVRCNQGHFYENTQHTSCPHCGVPGLADNMPPSTVAHRPVPPPENNGTQPMGGHTVGRNDPRAAGGVTVRLGPARSADFDPVVGWLVCIDGPEKGRDYRLRAGRNNIGRDPRMNVCIEADNTISNENHAAVAYSIKNHTFSLVPGEGRNLVYLNDADVLAPVLLAAFNVIELGKTKLLFVPLCGDGFRWDVAQPPS